MGNDFNINFKYKGMTGGAGGGGPKGAGAGDPSNLREIRQKAIQASKENEKKGGTINALTKNLIDSNIKLNASIQQLIAAMNKNGMGGGGPETGRKAFAGGFLGGAMSQMPELESLR